VLDDDRRSCHHIELGRAVLIHQPSAAKGGTMALTERQRKFYETTLQTTKTEMEELDRLIEEELAKVRDRLAELRNAKQASRRMYEAACMRLGVPSDIEADEAEIARP
jgi:hypothetical protein